MFLTNTPPIVITSTVIITISIILAISSSLVWRKLSKKNAERGAVGSIFLHCCYALSFTFKAVISLISAYLNLFGFVEIDLLENPYSIVFITGRQINYNYIID